MGKPKKPPNEKLVPVCVSLPPEVFDALDRVARAHQVGLSVVLRRIVVGRYREYETTRKPIPSTL